MTRMTRMVGFSIPPTMAEEFERIANEEQRTKSELFREMFRVYRSYRRQKRQDEEGSGRLVTEATEEIQIADGTEMRREESLRPAARKVCERRKP